MKNKRKKLLKKLKSKNLKLKRLLWKIKIKSKNPKNKFSTQLNIIKIDLKWLANWKNLHKHTHIHINLMLKSQYLNSYKSMILCVKTTENFYKKTLLSLEELLTLELKVKISFSTTWKAKEKSFKSCAILMVIKGFNHLLKFILNLEEEILSELLVNLVEQQEDNFLLLQDKFSFYLHASTCYLNHMLVSKINNPDIEKDILI